MSEFKMIRITCEAFQREECSGVECPMGFTHPAIQCRNWASGYCPFGGKCRFLHRTAEQVRELAKLEGSRVRRAVCLAYQLGECKNGDACPMSHPTTPCIAFNNGGCRRGDSCWFLHRTPEQLAILKRRSEYKGHIAICTMYQARKSCSGGIFCELLHPYIQCKIYARTKSCPNGDSCAFLHRTNEEVQEMIKRGEFGSHVYRPTCTCRRCANKTARDANKRVLMWEAGVFYNQAQAEERDEEHLSVSGLDLGQSDDDDDDDGDPSHFFLPRDIIAEALDAI